MKDIYVNPALAPLLIRHRPRPPVRIFSVGGAWFLLTPSRLAAVAGAVGLADPRVRRLIYLLRRHAPRPEAHCRRLGIPESRYVPPEAYALALCPRCDRPHRPHPADAAGICPECREASALRDNALPGGVRLDRLLDAAARVRLLAEHPDEFDGGVLSPNWKFNRDRVMERDWDAAVGLLLAGRTYRDVAREFSCSVGVLHKRAAERKAERTAWENN